MKTKICDNMKSCSCMGEAKEANEESKMDMKEGMGKCMEAMKGGKWFMLFPGLILATAFLLTFFLNPEAVQVLWLVITGTLLGMGLTIILLITLWFRKIKKEIKA